MTDPPPRRFRPAGRPTWSAAGTAVAVITSAVALTFTLRPGLAPDPRTMLAGAMAVQTVQPRVSFGDYLAQFHPDQLSRTAMSTRLAAGDVVYLRVQIQGEKHGGVSLYPVIYDWKTKRPFQLARPPSANGFLPGTPNDQWVAPVWVADPQLGRDFFVRLMLFDRGVILAFADTSRIAAQ